MNACSGAPPASAPRTAAPAEPASPVEPAPAAPAAPVAPSEPAPPPAREVHWFPVAPACEAVPIDQLPVPEGATLYAFRDGKKVVEADRLCALPTRIVEGCVGMMKCYYQTAKKGLRFLRIFSDMRLQGAGSVGENREDPKAEDCLPMSEDTIAMCATATETVWVTPAVCSPAGIDPTSVVLKLEVLAADTTIAVEENGDGSGTRIIGNLEKLEPDRWSYRFVTEREVGAKPMTLRFAVGRSPSATLNIHDHDEPCLAFALYGRR